MEEPWDPKEGTGLALVQRLQQEGLDGPLRWLQNCLRRTARDRETEGMSFPVPLVPLSEENEDAMENRGFRALLREVGLRPPANEQVMPPSLSPSLSPLLLAQPTASSLCPQESFWRIPAALTPQQLRRAATSITPSSPQELPPQELPVAPKNLAGGESVGWGQGAGEEPLSIPAPSGSKRRRQQLDSEEEEDGDLGGCSPLPDLWGGGAYFSFYP
ncbi:TIM protein, partial [Odontophorus gujanensis]|nr:TIM protein [Odontophorus gujanensis]